MLNLRHFHLGGNFLAGQISIEYERWEHLLYLVVSGNELAGAISLEIGNLTRLREIGNLLDSRVDATTCGLTKRDCSRNRELQKLDTLFFEVNVLPGPLAPELGEEHGKDEGDEDLNWLITFNDSSKLSEGSIRF